MGNNLHVTGNLLIDGSSVFTGTTNLGAALDTNLVTNFNADKVDGADLSIDGTLAANSDVLVPSQKAVKTYAAGLAGAGRTTETIKGNADAIAALDAAVVKKTGAQTAAGVKTFSDGIDSGGNGAALKFKILALTYVANQSCSVAHGLTGSKIRGLAATIYHTPGSMVNRVAHDDTYVWVSLMVDSTVNGNVVVFYEP
jgi:hypothetical protein